MTDRHSLIKNSTYPHNFEGYHGQAAVMPISQNKEASKPSYHSTSGWDVNAKALDSLAKQNGRY